MLYKKSISCRQKKDDAHSENILCLEKQFFSIAVEGWDFLFNGIFVFYSREGSFKIIIHILLVVHEIQIPKHLEKM